MVFLVSFVVLGRNQPYRPSVSVCVNFWGIAAAKEAINGFTEPGLALPAGG